MIDKDEGTGELGYNVCGLVLYPRVRFDGMERVPAQGSGREDDGMAEAKGGVEGRLGDGRVGRRWDIWLEYRYG